MRQRVLVAVSLLLALCWAQNCPTYSCTGLPADECISVIENNATTVFQIQQCPAGFYCPTVQTGTSSCQPFPQPALYPGDFCVSNTTCSSSVCASGQCVGLSIGSPCLNVYDCNPGLKCNVTTLLCDVQATEGESCYLTYDCENDLICNLGTCVPYLSLSVGKPTDQIKNEEMGLALACESGFAIGSGATGYTCAVAPVSKGEIPVSCIPGATAQCIDSTSSYSSACKCGYNAQAAGFCSLFPGDSPAQVAFAELAILVLYNHKCNTYSRFSYDCFANTDLEMYLPVFYNYSANFALLTSTSYPLVQNNSQCVQSVFTNEYWELKSDLDDYSNALCPIYVCEPSFPNNWEPNQCIRYESTTYQFLPQNFMYLWNCADNTTQCKVAELHNSTCVPVQNQGYPGDYCEYSTDCISNQCNNNECAGGLQATTPCTNVYDCNPGLFCNFSALPYTCQTQKMLEETCDTSYDCQNSLTCSLGKCVQYYSLGIGQTTDSLDATGLSDACETGFAAPQSSGLGICSEAPVSSKTGLQSCVPGTQCLSYGGTYSKDCICTYNAEGQSYCPLFEGDMPMTLARYNYQYLLGASDGCNTASRTLERCYKKTPSVLQYFYSYALNLTYFQLYPAIEGSDSCALPIYTYQYNLLLQGQANNHYTPPDPNDNDDKNSTAKFILFPAVASLLMTFT